MKKLIALLAALTMLFVCGCGSNSKDNGKDNGNGTNNAVDNNTVDERHDTNTNTVGDDVRNGVDDAGNAIRDGADAVTGDNNNAAKQPNTANGTNAPAENP